MKQTHVILRTITGSRAPQPGGASAGPLGQAGGLDVDVETLDPSEVGRVARHRDVVAVAPAIPMKLIEPVTTPGAQPAASSVDWGVKAVGADTSPFTGDGIVVAVLDTGIDSAHPAFTGVTLVRENFTEDADGNDLHGHGTHCAGTIFGRDVSDTRIGVACGVKKALIGKVLGAGGGGSDQIVRAIQWAVDQGAPSDLHVAGDGLSGFQRRLVEELGFPPELATSRALEGYRANVLLFERLASTIKSMGDFGTSTVIVAAAGNESQTEVNPDFEIG